MYFEVLKKIHRWLFLFVKGHSLSVYRWDRVVRILNTNSFFSAYPKFLFKWISSRLMIYSATVLWKINIKTDKNLLRGKRWETHYDFSCFLLNTAWKRSKVSKEKQTNKNGLARAMHKIASIFKTWRSKSKLTETFHNF